MKRSKDMTGTGKCVIRGIGMVSAVGVSASQSCASIQAGISRAMAMPEIYYCMPDDPDFEAGTELIAAPLSFLNSRRDTYPQPAEWLSLISEKAFLDLLGSSAYHDERDNETGLFISLPPKLIENTPHAKDEFIYHFHNRIQKDLFPVEDYSFKGHTGVFEMIEAASKAMNEGKISSALVGGVQSSLFPDWLSDLDREYRIKSRRNLDGYIPGEAAAFIWMEKISRIPEKMPVTLTIDSQSWDEGIQSPLTPGSSLKNVVSSLLNDHDDTPVIFCDLNGESKRMEEWGFVRTSLGERLENPVHLEHPADVLGDVGAATGTVLIITAMHHLQVVNPDRHTALIWTASDHGERRGLTLKKTMREPSGTHQE